MCILCALDLFLFLVEIMTHVAWKQSCMPPTHVIGVGCNLESERFSYVLNVALLANSTNKKAWVIGELSDKKGELIWTFSVISDDAACL